MDLTRTARVTGLWYLALGLAGMLGFLVVRPRLHDTDDPVATAANLLEYGSLARLGLVLEMALVVCQVVTALWFHRLLRHLDRDAAVAVAVLGSFNAVALLTSATFLWTALAVAAQPELAPAGDPAAAVGLLYRLSESAWAVGSVFFGLWLVPLGRAVVTSGRWPAALGRVLVVGGVGYLLSTFASAVLPGAPAALVQVLTVPATVGEFWMIGYLLSHGIRRVPGRGTDGDPSTATGGRTPADVRPPVDAPRPPDAGR